MDLTDRQLARLADDALRRANRLLEDEPLPTRCQGCIDRDCALDALTASRDRWERRWRRAMWMLMGAGLVIAGLAGRVWG